MPSRLVGIHRTLGPGLLESIYEEALCHEFDLRGIGCRRQVEIDVIYKEKVIKGQRLDVLVEDEVIVEIKSLSKLADVSMAQVHFLSKSNRFETSIDNQSRCIGTA